MGVVSEDVNAGDGTYVYLGKIYAQTKGLVEVLPANSWNNESTVALITVAGKLT